MAVLSRSENTVLSPSTTPCPSLHLREPASAVTHFIGMVSALSATPFLLEKAARHADPLSMISCMLFIASMVLLYGASTAYHAAVASERTILFLKKLDHIMIYFLIAGSYTPVCLLVLPHGQGAALCAIIWGLACGGLFLTAVWVTSPKWLNSTIYIAMGWLCLFAIRSIYAHMSPACFAWLFAGGIIYTAGGVIYAMKLPLFDHLHPGFGSHEIFHLFVMGGSLCHFIMVYGYLI